MQGTQCMVFTGVSTGGGGGGGGGTDPRPSPEAQSGEFGVSPMASGIEDSALAAMPLSPETRLTDFPTV